MSTSAHKTMAQRMLERAWQARHPEEGDGSSSAQGVVPRPASGGEFPEDFQEPVRPTYVRLSYPHFDDETPEAYPVPVRCLHSDPAELL